MLITLSYYMPNESPNAVCIDLDAIRLYFSYDQIVAYWTKDEKLIVCENEWTRTHGKHINKLLKHPGATQVCVTEFGFRVSKLLKRIMFAYNHLELMRIVEESNEEATK